MARNVPPKRYHSVPCSTFDDRSPVAIASTRSHHAPESGRTEDQAHHIVVPAAVTWKALRTSSSVRTLIRGASYFAFVSFWSIGESFVFSFKGLSFRAGSNYACDDTKHSRESNCSTIFSTSHFASTKLTESKWSQRVFASSETLWG